MRSTLPRWQGKQAVVVIATRDCATWLDEALASCARQTADDIQWGVLVIDDGSTDLTAEVCHRWGATVIHFPESGGKIRCLRAAAMVLDPETIMVELDADDALDEDAVEDMLTAWTKHPDAAMIYSQYMCVNEDWSVRSGGHNRPTGLCVEDAGWISHLKTYRAADLVKADLDVKIRKSTDKETIYRLQEVAKREGRRFEYVDKILYMYRRRASGTITDMRHLDATAARRAAVKRRTGKDEDALTVYDAGRSNDTGGPGIFWTRLIAGLDAREDIMFVGSPEDADVVLGNVRIPQGTDHARPWVVRIDGVHFNTHFDYVCRNVPIKASVAEAEGIVYQGDWGRMMCNRYCEISRNMTTIIQNGVDPPEGWCRMPAARRTRFIACSRWGDERYARKFKRLEATIEAFSLSELAKHGYTLDILGQHYLDEAKYLSRGVDFRGRVPSDRVWDYLAEAVAVIHLSWLDCCPNTVVEAMAAHVPVIYCADGAAEIVGEAGYRIPDGPLKDPCDTGCPPDLDMDDVVLAMHEAAFALDIGDAHIKGVMPEDFPDVSMAKCIDQYAGFLFEIRANGPLKRRVKRRDPRAMKVVIASTDDMR